MEIEELLKSMLTLKKESKESRILENSKETWERIFRKDSFSELGLTPSELDAFLQEWIAENTYSNL